MSERIINDIGTFMFGGPPRCPKCGKYIILPKHTARKENICGCEESK